jgi:poly-beta-hydroxyalkanoate depolymerase
MLTIQDLIDQLTEVADELGGDTPVMAAIQPSYPLAHQIAGVSVTGEDTEDSPTVWIAVSDDHSTASPYAPTDAWRVR